MIVGIGSDITDISRIGDSMQRFGQRFLDRCFLPSEQSHCRDSAESVQKFARRWAGKEATAKALGTGIGEHAYFHDIEIVSGPLGRPELHLSGSALKTLMQRIPAGYRPACHITMTDEGKYAQAFVVLEAVPDHM